MVQTIYTHGKNAYGINGNPQPELTTWSVCSRLITVYIDGTGVTVTAGLGRTGRDGQTVVKVVSSSRVDKFLNRRPLPSRPATKLCPVVLYRPVPSENQSRCTRPSRPVDTITPAVHFRPVASRNRYLPSRPVIQTCTPADETCPTFTPTRCFPVHYRQEIPKFRISSF